MFETTVADGVLQFRREGTRWLSTGWDGGVDRADAAYNVTVPDGWGHTDLRAYVDDRRERAGFDAAGPTLLTGVEMRHARGARLDAVVAAATVGLSNPAALPLEPAGGERRPTTDAHRAGTVNVLVGTTRALTEGALATLLGVAVEAKTATLLGETPFPGTTTDAVIVGADERADEPTEREAFAGSATAVGAAARACVRDSVRASVRARYADREVPGSVDDAEHGVVTDRRAEVFAP